MGVLTLFLALTSCKKETKISTNAASTDNTSKLKTNTLPAPTYVDLALVARKPGENFDTYHATFHGSSIYLIGPLVYDQAKYPNLVNGVPGFGQSMYGDNYATVDYQNTGPDGNVFGGTQGTMSVTDLSAYHKDLESYFKAVDT